MSFVPSACRRGSRVAALLLAGVASGCAHYAADPPRGPAALFAAPDVAALSVAAGAIDRPFLTAQPIDLDAPLTLNALAVITIIESPDLKALRAKSGVTDAQAFAARLLPDPTVQFGFDKRLSGPDPFNGFTGQIAFDLNQLRLRRVTRQAQAATKDQVRLDLAWAEWQAAGQARLLGVRIGALTTATALTRASATQASTVLDTVLRAAGRGDIGGAELDLRRQAALDAADKERTAESALIAARGDLNKALGLPPATVLRLAPPPPAAPLPSAAALVALALDRRLDLAALRAGYQAQEAETHKQVLEQFPTLSLALAGARDTANNRTLGPQVGFTLPLWNRNRGGIAIATATRAQLKAEYEARLFATRADITDAVVSVATSQRQRSALLAALPPLRRYAVAMVRAAARGDLPRATGAAATQAVRDRDLALVTLDQTIAEQTIALELLTGTLREGWPR
jgi:cobalt-zinc-cadmium efflux system outer membrane protein